MNAFSKRVSTLRLCLLVPFVLLAVACGGDTVSEAPDPEPAPATAEVEPRPNPNPVTPPTAEPPSFLENENEVAMQALSTSVFAPVPSAECGLTEPESEGAKVYFGCTPEEGPILRAVAARSVEPDDPKSALQALLAGPTTDERSQGYLSSFGPQTAGIPWTSGQEDDLFWIDFDPEILKVEGLFVAPMDVAQIVATAGQGEGVDRVLILVDGEPLCKAQGEC